MTGIAVLGNGSRCAEHPDTGSRLCNQRAGRGVAACVSVRGGPGGPPGAGLRYRPAVASLRRHRRDGPRGIGWMSNRAVAPWPSPATWPAVSLGDRPRSGRAVCLIGPRSGACDNLRVPAVGPIVGKVEIPAAEPDRRQQRRVSARSQCSLFLSGPARQAAAGRGCGGACHAPARGVAAAHPHARGQLVVAVAATGLRSGASACGRPTAGGKRAVGTNEREGGGVGRGGGVPQGVPGWPRPQRARWGGPESHPRGRPRAIVAHGRGRPVYGGGARQLAAGAAAAAPQQIPALWRAGRSVCRRLGRVEKKSRPSGTNSRKLSVSPLALSH